MIEQREASYQTGRRRRRRRHGGDVTEVRNSEREIWVRLGLNLNSLNQRKDRISEEEERLGLPGWGRDARRSLTTALEASSSSTAANPIGEKSWRFGCLIFDGYEEIEEKERKPKMGSDVQFVRFLNKNTETEPNSVTRTSLPSRTLSLPKFRLKSVRIGSKIGRFGKIG